MLSYWWKSEGLLQKEMTKKEAAGRKSAIFDEINVIRL
jgi:hypothetical protein